MLEEMISEGSCDSESGVLNYILQFSRKQLFLNNISQYFCFYYIFDEIKASLVRPLSKYILKSYQSHIFEWFCIYA